MRSLALALGLVAAAAALPAALPAARASEGAQTQRIKVMPGDTLWSIAQKYLKDPTRWNVLLRYNRLPTSDPTVALPGMSLTVPKSELKERYQAAELVFMQRDVTYRASESPAWNSAHPSMELFEDWGLRTQDESMARVRFFNGGVLTLAPDSMAILRAPQKADYDLKLERGTIHSTVARVVTPSARIVPKGKQTRYTASVLDDLSTRVQVYKGAADVQDLKGDKTVEVRAGYYTRVELGRAPQVPTKMPRADLAMAPEVRDLGRASGDAAVAVRNVAPALQGGGALARDLARLSVGVPVLAYVVETARDADFTVGVSTRQFDAGEEFNPCYRGAGTYHVRVAVLDLLGERSAWSAARTCKPGDEGAFQSMAFTATLEVTRPAQDVTKVGVPNYRIVGRASKDVTVLINGDKVGVDEDGLFSTDVELHQGANNFRIEATDVSGNDKVIIRRIDFEP